MARTVVSGRFDSRRLREASSRELADALGKEGVTVDLLVTIEPVGVGDNETPENVVRHVNITSADASSDPWVKKDIKGAQNFQYNPDRHTKLDEAVVTQVMKLIQEAVQRKKDEENLDL